jgi:hypothetical protein
MKTILLIDDLRVFRTPDADAELHIARNSAEALVILQENPDKHWDEIWFDHDLGIVNGKKDTTLPVADHLAERAFFDNPVSVGTAFIQTSNPAGLRDITNTLQRFGYKTVRVQAEKVFNIDPVLYWKSLHGEGKETS